MSAAGIIDEGWLVKYLNSYYFSIVLNCFSFFKMHYLERLLQLAMVIFHQEIILKKF